jgi:hypothetical protein
MSCSAKELRLMAASSRGQGPAVPVLLAPSARAAEKRVLSCPAAEEEEGEEEEEEEEEEEALEDAAPAPERAGHCSLRAFSQCCSRLSSRGALPPELSAAAACPEPSASSSSLAALEKCPACRWWCSSAASREGSSGCAAREKSSGRSAAEAAEQRKRAEVEQNRRLPAEA